jgi:hypothetical protein
MITPAQTKVLNRARDVLESLQEKATDADGFRDGRVAEAAAAAELALFNVLNLTNVPDMDLFNRRVSDIERIRAAHAAEVEYDYRGSYLTDNEARVGRHLYYVSILNQRHGAVMHR